MGHMIWPMWHGYSPSWKTGEWTINRTKIVTFGFSKRSSFWVNASGDQPDKIWDSECYNFLSGLLFTLLFFRMDCICHKLLFHYYSLRLRIPTVKLKIPGKLFLKSNSELLLHSSYSFWPLAIVFSIFHIFSWLRTITWM